MIWPAAVLSAAMALVMPAPAAPGDVEFEAPGPPEGHGQGVGPLSGALHDLALPDAGADLATTVYRDLSRLPPQVAETRDKLMEAARTGDLEALRPIIEAQDEPPTVSFGGAEDAVDFLRETSTDGEGRELLGIFLELLEAPFAVVGEGTESAVYVWPYLAAVPLEGLTPPELVELYKLVSHSDFENMLDFGGWYFFRAGIAQDGHWAFFVSGD